MTGMAESRTERLLDEGFTQWELMRPELDTDMKPFTDRDPQFFQDWRVVLERAQVGSCRRKEPGPVPDEGDWDAPMVRRPHLGELRMPTHDLGWQPRTYVSACLFDVGVMVALKLGDKSAIFNDGQHPNEVQNEHLDEAAARLNVRDGRKRGL